MESEGQGDGNHVDSFSVWGVRSSLKRDHYRRRGGDGDKHWGSKRETGVFNERKKENYLASARKHPALMKGRDESKQVEEGKQFRRKLMLGGIGGKEESFYQGESGKTPSQPEKEGGVLLISERPPDMRNEKKKGERQRKGHGLSKKEKKGIITDKAHSQNRC